MFAESVIKGTVHILRNQIVGIPPLFPYIKIERFGDFHPPPMGDDVIYERSQSTESNQRYRRARLVVDVMRNSGAAQVVHEEGVGKIE